MTFTPTDPEILKKRRASLRSLPSPDSLLRSAGAYAKHALGQHFLTDTAVTDDIIYRHGPIDGKHVIEIGPGAGTLTRSLLYHDVASLTVIERDERFADMMRRVYAPCAPGVFTAMEDDALHIEKYLPEQGSGAPRDIHIIANLPYNIGTELVARWLARGDSIQAISVMLQKETAERFAAGPGSGKYGRLSVLGGLFTDADISMHIPPAMFNPPPKVDSAILRMYFLDKARFGVTETRHIEVLVRQLFSSRRQTLRRSFKRIAGDSAAQLLEDAGIDGALRPEHVTLEQFVRLADAYKAVAQSQKTV